MNDVALISVLSDGKILAAGGLDYLWAGRFNPDGTLDTTWGFGGLTSVDPTSQRDRPKAMAVDPAGRVILAGSAKWQSPDEYAVVVRFNGAGRPDTTFGGGDGVVELTAGNLVRGAALALRPEANGNILAAGSSTLGFFLAHFLADGTPDPAFGTGGYVLTLDGRFTSPPTLSLRSMEFLPDGRVVAAGPASGQPGPNGRAVVRRYLPDGSLDASFGTNGEARATYPSQSLVVDDVAVSPTGDVAIPLTTQGADTQSAVVARFTPAGQPDVAFGGGVVAAPYRLPVEVQLYDAAESLDGKLVAFGQFQGGLLVAQFNRDGSLDTSFSADGWNVVPGIGPAGGLGAVIEADVLPDGRMLVALDRVLIRLNPDGTPDPTFVFGGGSRGIVDFAFQPDGKIVTASPFVAEANSNAQFQTTRYNADGSIDRSFSGDGLVVTDVSAADQDRPTAVAVLSDGAILVGGAAYLSPPGTAWEWALVRYLPDGTPDVDFGNQFNRPGVRLVSTPGGIRGGELQDLVALPGAAFYAAGDFDDDFAVGRFRADGTPDPGFSGDGFGFAGFPLLGYSARADWLDRQADGKLVLGGRASGPYASFGAARFNPDGTLDTTFGSAGRSIVQTGTTPSDMQLMSDGGIVFVEPVIPTIIRLQGDVPAAITPTSRDVFYNDSAFDGRDPRTTPADLAAVAADKQALRPGQVASFANVTSYTKGVNGVMVELSGIPSAEVLPGDFDFRWGTGGDPASWSLAAQPNWLHLVPSTGGQSAARYAITWPDGAIRNTWIQVTVKANARTGLSAPDVFYFGNLVGDTGASPLRVDTQDYFAERAALGSRALPSSNPFDFDRDRRVTASDLVALRANLGAALLPIAPGAAAAASTIAHGPSRRRAAYLLI